MHTQAKKIYKLTLIIVWFPFFFLFSEKSICQQTKNNTQAWDSISALYKSGKITDTAYLNRAFRLSFQYDKSPHLKDLLATYREIAFSKKKHGKYRRNYYLLLANNALWSDNIGARIFYLEKAEEEQKLLPDYFPTLNSAQVEITFLAGAKNTAEALEKSKKQFPFIDTLPALIETGKISFSTVDNANQILMVMQEIYHQLNDTTASARILALQKKILDAVKKRSEKYNDMTISIYKRDNLMMQYRQHKFLGDTEGAENNLRLVLAECVRAKTLDYQWGDYGKITADIDLFNFFLEQKKIDSAETYLDYYKEDNFKLNNSVFLDRIYFELSSALMKEKGNYKHAFDDLKIAYDLNDSTTNAKISDNKNNLYAQTEAEYNKAELDKSEKQKRQRDLLIIAISVFLGSGIFLLIRLVKRNRSAAQKNIEQLNFASNLQIAELEERNRMIKQEEQKRLGMDLHDNLAGSLAAAKLKVETEILHNKDTEQVERLKVIKDIIHNTYESTRNKSHELYLGRKDEFEILFSKRVQVIVDNAFSSSKIKTEIMVDDNALTDTSIEVKIELLHIIHESIINILKHSHATKASISIYEDISGLVLHISDNGKGFNANLQKKGIGLSSIKTRAAHLNGSAEISSGNKGTELTVTI